jgi:MoxR-like ATPase
MATMTQKGLLDGLVVGWQDIEPILVACVACDLNLVLRGRHGASKTIFAKIVAQAIGGEYRHYDATKDDLVTMAGIPNPEALSRGELEFARHRRTAWDADYISIDELTRATRESQNLWLELLEERTLYGKPLKYKMAVATMNPSTYAATYRLDEALLDRFIAVVDIPDVLSGKSVDVIQNIVAMNMNGNRGTRDAERVAAFGKSLHDVQQCYKSYMHNETIKQAVQKYVGVFGAELRANVKPDECYFSPRRLIQLANAIVACASYYRHIQTFGWNPPKDGIFVEAALQAVTYVVASALNVPFKTVEGCHAKARDYLKNISGSESDKLHYEIRNATKASAKIALVRKNIDTIGGWSPADVNGIVHAVASEIVDGMMEQLDGVKGKKETSAAAVKRLVEAGKAYDEMFELCGDLERSQAVVLHAASESAHGWMRLGVVKAMNQIMTRYSSGDSDSAKQVCTFGRVVQVGESVKKIQEVWRGTLVDGSMEKTIKLVFGIS